MLDNRQIRGFLKAVAEHLSQPAKLYLLGGSALALLGGPRPTLDIDYVGDDITKTDFQKTIDQVAESLGLVAEAVPIHKFIPIPDQGTDESIYFEKIGDLEVFIYDPLSIALSKIDRGFDTDLDDVLFLIWEGYISIDSLTARLDDALQKAGQFDIDPVEARAHMSELLKRLD
jgi:hypothetical protein